MMGQSIWARAFNRSRDERGSVAIEAAMIYRYGQLVELQKLTIA